MVSLDSIIFQKVGSETYSKLRECFPEYYKFEGPKVVFSPYERYRIEESGLSPSEIRQQIAEYDKDRSNVDEIVVDLCNNRDSKSGVSIIPLYTIFVVFILILILSLLVSKYRSRGRRGVSS